MWIKIVSAGVLSGECIVNGSFMFLACEQCKRVKYFGWIGGHSAAFASIMPYMVTYQGKGGAVSAQDKAGSTQAAGLKRNQQFGRSNGVLMPESATNIANSDTNCSW